MHNIIIIRYGELALKGKNRAEFERKLVRNIRDCLKKNKTEFGRIMRKRGRLFIETKEKCPQLSHVFGISSFSHAVKTIFDIGRIKTIIEELLKARKFGKFRLSSKRSDKSTSMNSQELNIELGQFVVDRFNAKVSLKHPDIDIGVEIQEGVAHIFVDDVPGPKGLPYGVNGQAFALIDHRRSMLAAWLMMKRGLKIIPVALKDKDISVLEKYNYGYRPLKIVRIRDIREIREIGMKMGVISLITGETLADLKKNRSKTNQDMLKLAPLVGFNDSRIKCLLKDL